MGFESTATYISDLVATNPTTSDGVAQGDDHLRKIKEVLQAQFPNLGAAAVTPTAAELNYVDGVTSAIQTQIDSKLATASGLGRWVRLGSANAASASAVDFINGTGGIVFNSTYDAYCIEFISLVGSGARLWLRTTTNASTFDSTAGHYKYATARFSSLETDAGTATAIALTYDNMSGATTSVNGQLFVYAPATAQPAQMIWSLSNGDGSQPLPSFGQGYRNTAADIDGFRILPSTGSFTSGTVNLYGRVKA